MKKEVILNNREQKRLLVMNEMLAGRVTGQEAAEMLGLSLRHTRRLLAAYRQHGAVALAHGNRGRAPSNKITEEVEKEIVRLGQGPYHDYNDSHFREELEERHNIQYSRSTIRRVRRRHGLPTPRKRRPPRHRRRRQRYPQTGMLLQVDGSKHDWLEGRGPWLTLHAAIDDATNEVPWAVFREEEDATGYLMLLHHISLTHGLPLALYADRHTIFQSPKIATIAEQLEGLEPRSHLGRLLETLDIGLISARSPQAKGRVERLFETLQDRLVKELRRANACTLAEANACLKAYLPRFNSRFMKPPAEAGSAYRPRLARAEANERICFTYWRTVSKDHTISLFGHTLLLAVPRRLNLAGQRVELRHRLDGRLAVFHKGQKLTMIQPAHLGPPKLEQFDPLPSELTGPTADNTKNQTSAPPAAPVKRNQYKPPENHPWRRDKKLELERKQWQLRQKQKGSG
jgi:transposase